MIALRGIETIADYPLRMQQALAAHGRFERYLSYFIPTSIYCDIFLTYSSMFDCRSISRFREWSGGAKVLGKLSVPGRHTYLDNSRARAYCACSRCGFFSYLFSILSPSLRDGPI